MERTKQHSALVRILELRMLMTIDYFKITVAISN